MAYVLKIRDNDSEPWRFAEAFTTEKAADKASAFARIIGGYRTHTYRESKAEESARRLLEEELAVK